MDVDDHGLAVRTFTDGFLMRHLSSPPPPPPERWLAPEDAARRAALYMRAAGISLDDLVLASVERNSASVGVTSAADCSWNVQWRREWSGVPYES